jgi:hypothetical protein
MLTSEQIESEVIFLRLFAPGVLTILPKEDLWNKVHIIRSSPGGGKTSILRLFSPGTLLTLYDHRSSNNEFSDLYQNIKSLNALDKDGPKVLGIMLSCTKNYDLLEDLDFDIAHKKMLFNSLLDSRIILAALRGILELKRLEYPKDIERISINLPADFNLPLGFPPEPNGVDLYRWASGVEKDICKTIDSFDTVDMQTFIGQDNLISPFILNPKFLLCDEKPIVPHVLIMLDDCHKLTRTQRTQLLSIIDQRPPIGIWISERLEALQQNELLSPGSMPERDVIYIDLENLWGSSKSKFEKIALSIADKRAQFAAHVDIQSFSAQLQEELEIGYKADIQNAISKISTRIIEKAKDSRKHSEWISTLNKSEETPIKRAISWRALEILMERDGQKNLSDFLPDLELSSDERELIGLEDASVRSAAELMLSTEFKFPYYYGEARLAAIASSNIEQFLWLSGNLFEEIISSYLVSPGSRLSTKRQEGIIKNSLKERWNKIPYRVKNGREVMKLIESIGKFAQQETMKPNAPYAPGVTGIGISRADVDKLEQSEGENNELGLILSECIAHRLLEARPNIKCKDKYWLVLYLNRTLCAQFGLPLQYGGWKEKRLHELMIWAKKGYTTKK